MIDSSWEGKAQFYELVFGIWLAYAFLVVMWERLFKVPLAEYKYVLITFLGSSFFLVNHYFQAASFYIWLLNGYSVIFMFIYFRVMVNPLPTRNRTRLWRTCVTLSSIPFTIAFIFFENIARSIVSRGYSEFWTMLISYFGFLWLILWRASDAGTVAIRNNTRLETGKDE